MGTRKSDKAVGAMGDELIDRGEVNDKLVTKKQGVRFSGEQ